MIRGTTAQFKFKLPYKIDELNWATIKFWQPGNSGTLDAPLPITKRLIDCSATDNPNELCVSLTAKETLRFSDKIKARVQLRAESNDGTTFASRESLITVYPISDDIIVDNPDIPDVPSGNDGFVRLDGMSIIQR
jgi:hypothetical protein